MRLTEEQIIKELFNSKERYKPLIFKDLFQERLPPNTNIRVDAVGTVCIENGFCFKTLLEIVPVATPNNILNKGKLLSSLLNDSEQLLLIAAPYISGKAAKILENEGISWVDLCGNMRISVPGKILIEKSGNKNKFPDTSPIKKIFEGNSSLVSRALLLQPEGFKSQYKLTDYINSRNANITNGTVSRVIKSLENELLIKRNNSIIKVMDQNKLLQSLSDGYKNYIKRKARNSIRFSIRNQNFASLRINVNKSNYLACGFYAAQLKGFGSTDEITIFVKNIEEARERFNFLEPDSEFGNFTFIEAPEDFIWFNSTDRELQITSTIKVSIPIVDDIQLYLEMMNDTPRGPKVAEKLRELILKKNKNG